MLLSAPLTSCAKPIILFTHFYIILLQQHYCCSSIYSSSCHRTASDANYWTIRKLFIAMSTSCLGVSSDSIFRLFSLNFSSTEFAACSKPPSRDYHRKVSYPMLHVTQTLKLLPPQQFQPFHKLKTNVKDFFI